MSHTLLLIDVEVAGRRVDVLVDGDRIAAIGRPSGPADEGLDGAGGALLPGLHDHHVHLMATAAARESLDLAEANAVAADAIRRADREMAPGVWLRVVGYHESLGGDLDRDALDALVPRRPVRVQHRSGAMWVLNSAGLAKLGEAVSAAPDGLERDPRGRPTGRCFRIDTWLRDYLPSSTPNVAAVAEELRRYGVTGVTDMTPYDSLAEIAPLLAALPLRITMTGSPALAESTFPSPLLTGPVKVLLEDTSPPAFDELGEWVRAAHRAGRNVAVHCVTRAALALMLAAWDEAGARRGDRIEHGAVVPPDFADRLAAMEITVVTQPSFVHRRGDQYLADVDDDDVPHLWPCRSLLTHGVRMAASTDTPFGPADPWAAIAAAVSRVTVSGRVLGDNEAIPAPRALDMFLGDPLDPGGPPRRVEVGAPADLCLLDRPLGDALALPSAANVRQSWLAGR